MLPYERLEVYWLADEYAAYVQHLLDCRRVGRNDADQLIRSATSIPNNIAEGSADRPPKERIRFFSYARRSTSESHNIIRRLSRSGPFTETDEGISYSYADRLSAMLYKLIRAQ